jgi:hypothetical protein
MRSEQQLQQLPSGEFSTGDTKYEGRLNQALAASQVRGDGMLRSLVGILIVFLLVPAFGQMKADYQPGTITAVVARTNTSPENSVASYDITLRVGSSLYVVLYTPPLDAGTPQYVAGSELLVTVGEKTVSFNDMVAKSLEVPIESSSPLEAPVRESIEADPPQAPTKAILVIGATGVKDNSNGSLTVEKGNLHFVHSKDTVDIAAPSITDLITGSDSQRVIRGTAGTISMFGPYGSGRFLSLFRSKLDTLTLQYRDPDGGLHGAIFTMSVGSAELLKQQLIAQGAHSTVEAEKPAVQETSKLSGTTEQKP